MTIGHRMIISLLITILLLQVGYSVSQSCPSTVATCTCEIGTSNRRIIRCKNLNTMPNFRQSSEVFLKLDLDDPSNNIQVLENNAFNGILVEEIDMAGSNIKLRDIQAQAFSGLEQHLKIIRLQGDKIIPPPFEPMKNLTNLKELQLQFFKLPLIDENTKFNYFPNLLTLRLRNTATTFVSSQSFMNQLFQLTRFEFENNAVQTFPKPAINRLRTLEHLSWLHNGMTRLTYGSFDSLNNLIELDLRGNEISVLDNECFKGITEKLEFLSIQLNRLNEMSIIPLGNHTWPQLEQLNLGHMLVDFQSIPPGFFKNMPRLASLIMPGNKLKVIKTNDFEGLGNIHSLDLSENWIHTIQKGAFAHMPLLDTLDLRTQYDVSSSNPLTFTLDAIQGSELAIKTLYLQDNHLIEQYAWEAIRAMKNLHNLDISNTKLASIPALIFYGHNQLGDLRVKNNSISVLRQESLYGLKDSLQTIDISSNRIYTVNDCVFKGFTNLKYIFAAGNILACDCNIYGFYLFLNTTITSNQGYANVRCSNLGNKELISLEANEVCPSPPTEATCPEFTTTTTSIPTTISKPDVQFGISSVTKDTIVISWTVSGDMTYLKNFLVQYKQLAVNNPNEKTFRLDKSKRDHPITGLSPGSSYEVCFFIELTVASSQILISCLTRQTQGGTVVTTAATVGSDDNTGKIVGGVLGGFLFIALLVVLFIVYTICKKRKDKKPPLPPPVATITNIGYQPRPTSQPRVFIKKANGELETVSNGKIDFSRLSGGSYSNIDPTVSNDPYPTKGATGGGGREASKQQHVKLPQEHKPRDSSDHSRYTRMPGAPPPSTHYVNEVRTAEPDHYTNAVETRPLPQTPNSKPLSDASGGGFLNHGFAPSPDTEYHELNFDSGTVV